MKQLRLAYLEALIVTKDAVYRQDIQDMFNVGSVSASRDFREYNKLYPGNIKYCIVTRRYKAALKFKSRALLTMADEFLVNLSALEDYF